MPRRLALFLSVLVGAALVSTPAAARNRPAGKLVPRTGALFGAHVDPDGRPQDLRSGPRQIRRFERRIGRKLDVDHHYYDWTDVFPTRFERWDLANGRIPLISWHGPRLVRILNGSYDRMIAARARGIAALRRPVFLRWCWEMNGHWSRCGGAGNGRRRGPARFVAAWRHLHDIFVHEGATNAVWVWSPYAQDLPARGWNHWTRYYPGDAYVDWVGIDGFGTPPWSDRSFQQIFGPVYADYAERRPIMIAEISTLEDGTGRKAMWFTNAHLDIVGAFPSIAAVVWFDTVTGGRNWRVDSSRSAFAAFVAMAQDPYFRTRPS